LRLKNHLPGVLPNLLKQKASRIEENTKLMRVENMLMNPILGSLSNETFQEIAPNEKKGRICQ